MLSGCAVTDSLLEDVIEWQNRPLVPNCALTCIFEILNTFGLRARRRKDD
jgi:hypothetical protein